MKKGKSNKKKLNRKKFAIFILIFAIILIGMCIGLNANKNKKIVNSSNLALSEFEKVAVYKYIENEFLDYDVLHILSNENNYNMDKDANKIEYSIAYSMKSNNSKVATLDEVISNYNKIFGENLDITNNYPLRNYSFDEDKQEYKVRDEAINQESNIYIMKITDIIENGPDENIIKIDILQPKEIDEFIDYYMANFERMNVNRDALSKLEELREKSITNTNSKILENDAETYQYLKTLVTDENKNDLTEKQASAELKLKVNNNQYSIVEYNENTIE